MRRLFVVIILAAICVSYLAWHIALRPQPAFMAAGDDRSLRGAFHVHSEASHDADVSVQDIARAARRRGLDFVVLTDHNAQLPATVTIDGVAIIAAAELSTRYGHLIQLSSAEVPPREERRSTAVIDVVHRAGGVPLIAHPADPGNPWQGPVAGAGGLEIANLASSARRRAGRHVGEFLAALAAYPLRPELALLQVLDRDTEALRLWDEIDDPGFVGLCGVDAHGLIDVALNLAAWNLVLERSAESAENLGETVAQRLSEGRFFCSAAILGNANGFVFVVHTPADPAPVGSSVAAEHALELYVKVPQVTPGGATTVLLRNGRDIISTRKAEIRLPAPEPGIYRVEVRAEVPHVFFGSRTLPVLYSNRIAVVDRRRLAGPAADPGAGRDPPGARATPR